MSYQQSLKRAGFLAASVGILGLAAAGIASAHVTANVYGPQPTKGGYGAIVFRVPNEDATAGTTKVEIDIKPEYALSSVRTKPIPGWTDEVTKTKLATPVKSVTGSDLTEVVTAVTWTAQPGTKIAATTQFQEFEISAGPFPKTVDELAFGAVQTYDSGKVVNWNEPTPPGGAEPEHPAPVVQLAAASASGGDGDTHAAMTSTAAQTGGTQAAAGSSDDTARWLGGAGLVVGALGLGAGAGAILRTRKAGATSKPEGTE